MKKYFFKLSGVWSVRADNLEEAQEELENLVMEFEDCEYDTEPIDIEE